MKNKVQIAILKFRLETLYKLRHEFYLTGRGEQWRYSELDTQTKEAEKEIQSLAVDSDGSEQSPQATDSLDTQTEPLPF